MTITSTPLTPAQAAHYAYAMHLNWASAHPWIDPRCAYGDLCPKGQHLLIVADDAGKRIQWPAPSRDARRGG